MSSFEFRLLGVVEMHGDGGMLTLSSAKSRALLAALALNANRPVSLDRLVEALWVLPAPRSAVANIRTYVTALRRALGDRIVAGSGSYQLRIERGELDVDEFARLAENGRAALAANDPAAAASHLGAALALWRGAAGEGLPRGTALETHLAGLTEQRSAVFEDFIEARLALAEHAEVIPVLRRYVARHPLRERAWAQLMLALYRTGDLAAALLVYREVQALLREDLGVEPGPDVEALHRAILARAPQLSITARPGVPPAGDAPSGQPPLLGARPRQLPLLGARPRQLPPVGPVFVGRERELGRLVDALRTATRRTPAVVVSGPGGVGKSALAVRASHLVAADFPDGQVYVDLRGLGATTPVDPSAEILATVLRALGVPAADVPARADERASRYRSLLAEARVLVVLDNASSAAQVRPLIPAGSTSVLLLTGRPGPLAAHAGYHVPLAALPDGDARQLLAELVGPSRVTADPAGVAELTRLCGNLPLALTIAGARLASRPRWPVDALVQQLSDERYRLDALTYGDLSMRDCIAVGYREVAAEDAIAARAFQLLGELPHGEVELPAAPTLLGVSAARAWRALEHLLDVHLVEAVPPDRYRVPGLLRQYAAGLAAAARRETPGDRVGPGRSTMSAAAS